MPPKKKPKEETKDEPKEVEIEEDNYTIFAELIENRLINMNPKFNSVCITNHTEICIDGILVSIYIDKENGLYNYEICSRFIHLDDDNEDDEDDDPSPVTLYEKCQFENLLDLQKDIHKVIKTHRLIEHTLLSPKEFEYATIQRKCFPISDGKLCCVCYEMTREYTICNHPICYRCRDKCVFSKQIACPICREENLNILPERLSCRHDYQYYE